MLSLSMVAEYYDISGQKDSLNFVYENKMMTVLKVTLIHQFIQYIAVILIYYF